MKPCRSGICLRATHDDFFGGTGPFIQNLTLRGNVSVQQASPLNNSQAIALYHDGGLANLTLNARLLFNTLRLPLDYRGATITR
jgi:hypothetical protein